MDTIIDRIRVIKIFYKLNGKGFAARIKFSAAVVSHYLKGRNDPSLPFVVAVLKYFPRISPDWLLFGKGKMLRNKKPS